MSTYLRDNNRPPDEYTNCPDFLVRYLAYRKNNGGIRPKTLVDTMTVLREYCQYVAYTRTLHLRPQLADDHKDMNIENMDIALVARISDAELNEYLCFLSIVARNTSATLNKKLCIIRRFYDYLAFVADELEISLSAKNPANGFKLCRHKKKNTPILSIAQLQTLLQAQTNTEPGLRIRFAMLLFATTGITLTEALALERKDLDGDWLLVRNSKGQDRFVLVTAATQKAAKQYFTLCENNDGTLPLFLSTKSTRPVTSRALQQAIGRAGADAGLPNITPNVLRNSAAFHMNRAAGKFGSSHVRQYLGYKMPGQHPFEKAEKDFFMQQVILSSPLGALE